MTTQENNFLDYITEQTRKAPRDLKKHILYGATKNSINLRRAHALCGVKYEDEREFFVRTNKEL